MIIRIVKMVFRSEEIKSFETLFESIKHKIASFPGCTHLQLLKGIDNDNTYFTYSYWNSIEDLEAYRHSELFKDTWSKTKPLFAQKAEAWSVTEKFNSSK
jgi:autoinducer 2-degrading protein